MLSHAKIDSSVTVNYQSPLLQCSHTCNSHPHSHIRFPLEKQPFDRQWSLEMRPSVDGKV